jgi:hypothetical protein
MCLMMCGWNACLSILSSDVDLEATGEALGRDEDAAGITQPFI